MSDKMTPIPFAGLMNRILAEHARGGAILGVEHRYHAPREYMLPLFNGHIETPFGPAAGPHTQLAQNIVAAYIAGARFFELKTVQVMDGEELRKCVPKPCILAADEGYNCEWSTELTVDQALDEYVKAYFICKLLSRELELGGADGFVFNMSVGYDYAGITSPKIDGFIEGMKDAAALPVFHECREWALHNLRLFERVNAGYIEGIGGGVCSSITLSTLHGCPPQEIERIAAYLIETKKLHTFVKCNPTILGYKTARATLDALGYGYIAFGERHFNEDLQFQDAVPMFTRLMELACGMRLRFGLKLSNTFPVDVTRGELPSEEMYMSGRALYPLTIKMADRFSRAFDGRLRLSFSGGADAFNLKELYLAGIWPVTMATTLLKPGGYDRLYQLANMFEPAGYAGHKGISVARVQQLSGIACQDSRYRKPTKDIPSKKIGGPLPFTRCFTAPCKSGCPIGQDIPEYVSLVGRGKYAKALRVITEKNPLPFITGSICPHRCMDKCRRGYYEEPIRIRSAKLEAARGGYEALLGDVDTPVMTSGKRAAVIGGGPAGLSAAYFLGRSGMPVTLFEKRRRLGGVVRYVIPAFRVSHHSVDRDVQLVERMGVQFELGRPAPAIDALKAMGYAYVIIAVGAWAPGVLKLRCGEAVNALSFLEECKNNAPDSPGNAGSAGGENVKHVCVVGGGNTAMDAARAAKRLAGVESVRIVYRRTKKYMPADEEELELCEREGILFSELLSPLGVKDGLLACDVMALGAPDEKGRRAPLPTGETVALPCDFLIAAVGCRVDDTVFTANGVALGEDGMPLTDAESLRTNLDGVYVVGDAVRGPATVVEAIADARRVADDILGAGDAPDLPAYAPNRPGECRNKCGHLEEYGDAVTEAGRCLYCDISCELCVQVCPNRANVAIEAPGLDERQILHIDGSCNECGNCAVFCPYDGAPYLHKPTLFHDETGFADSENEGFLHREEKRFRVRFAGQTRDIDLMGEETGLPKEIELLLRALCGAYAYLL
ncbi:MAG: putative selenate reductase subunit YgfK [Clostridiales bacterium]|nr:putative selenate reductase subunit YgfK [Clostridiales bacterium]